MIVMMFAAAAATVPPAPPAPQEIPAFFTGAKLLEICRDSPPRWRCSMYVAGVIDGIFVTESERLQSTICRAPLTNRRAGILVRDFLLKHPEYHPLAAATAVRAAVHERLGCRQEE